MSHRIDPWVEQLWPPEGDNRITNMDVVFFSDLEDGRTAPTPWKPGETWVQKGHPEVCWPKQWLPEDLGSNVRIFDIRPRYFFESTGVLDRSVEKAAMRLLKSVAEVCLLRLQYYIGDESGQWCPLVFVGHGYGGFVLKQALVELHRPSYIFKGLRSNLCGIVFYGGTNTKLTNKHGPMLMENKGRFVKNLTSLKIESFKDPLISEIVEDLLLEDTLSKLSEGFGAALDLKKVKVCVVNKNKSFLQEIKDYSDLDRQLIDVMDSNDICTPTSKDDPSYLEHHSTDFMDSNDIRTPASKDDPSYLECQLTGVMGSNDICKPTSKDDPSYYTFLKFLQQFLPKRLHQTIDDKKGQEIRLKLSETKDKEALGDMETASTSTRENRDKEMDERQCVVQHVVCNVDEDHDMLTEEAHKLRIFLREEMKRAQGHEGPTNFPNLHELHSKFLEDTSVFVGARKVEKDSIEFLFLDAQCMSKVVGVGLHQALVTVTNDNDVKVEALNESTWKSLFASMFMEDQGSGAFELIGFKMPKMEEDNSETMSLPSAEQVAKQFGVGLKDFQGDHIVTMYRKEESNMFFPVTLKVAEVYKALKEGDPHVTKRPSGVGSSTGASRDSSCGSTQQGKEESKRVQGRSLLKSSNLQEEGKDDEKDDEGKPPGGDPPPDFGSSNEPETGLPTYTVNVHAPAGRGFQDVSRIPLNIKQQITTASIYPAIFKIVFSRNKEKEKFFEVISQTQCNLSRNAQCNLDHDADRQPYFGWFQDDIMISFNGISPECQRTRLQTSTATNQKDEEGITTKDIINLARGENRGLAIQKSWSLIFKTMFGGEVGESSTRNVATNVLRTDSTEIISVKQIEGFNVHERHEEHNLTYVFGIPTSIKNSTTPSRFLRYHDTFTSKIVGNWKVLNGNKCQAAEYSFQVRRNLFHIEQNSITFGRRCRQNYELGMFINLEMTHLDGLRSNETIQIGQENLPGAPVSIIIAIGQ